MYYASIKMRKGIIIAYILNYYIDYSFSATSTPFGTDGATIATPPCRTRETYLMRAEGFFVVV